VLRHEYTHALVHDRTRGRAPTWLSEGLAIACEGRDTDNERQIVQSSDHLIPIRELHGSFLTLPRTEVPLAYAETAAAAEYHLRPVLTVLAFLVPMVLLTFYYYDQTQPAPFVPSNILVLALLNVDIILLVVLVLLLSRNLVKAYFERRQKLLGSGFRSKLIAAFVGFTLIPSLLLVGLASGLLSQSIDNWFGQEVEHALKDSR